MSENERADAVRWLLSQRTRGDVDGTAPAAAYGGPPVGALTEFDVVLEAVSAAVRLQVVKWLRARRSELSLADALALVAMAPNTVLEGLGSDDALATVRELVDLGASARLR